ncbi:DNA-processing protein DprA [Halobacillus naozhouensis]|uniref:DNA-processing protein DprA n=1 Tax=Halobacillus naozhouensis TaxID=554880 RepID=A0ABY8J3R3_9BACI|nr:DNA-processing protein DprA [Halobacillus naozhouensis]WFT76726.1 DNA-processing protein DprA [Halobacillus naozhouensis]
MNTFRQHLIRLHDCPYVTRKLLRTWLKEDPSLSDLLIISPKEIASILQITQEKARSIYIYLHDSTIMKKLDINEHKYKCVTYFDEEYPALLKIIPDPPLVLYTLGDIELLQHPLTLSVVGTRTPSKYAFPAMKQILLPLIQSNFCLVSGMAVGVDQHAHQLAVQHKGTTIAVMGSGFEQLYPRNNLPLFTHLCEHHLVISEYPPDRPPRKFHFPERNRIISGLSEATLVIEARLKSGSLITVDQALEQGREVLSLPGSIGSSTSEGCHAIIQEGARLVQSHQDVLSAYREKIN